MSCEVIPDIPHKSRPYSGPEVLAYYDGPLLMWLPVPGRHLLAVALPESKVNAWPFLVAEMTSQAAEALMGNTLTLKDAYTTASACYLVPDYGAPSLKFELVTTIPEEWMPGDCFLTR